MDTTVGCGRPQRCPQKCPHQPISTNSCSESARAVKGRRSRGADVSAPALDGLEPPLRTQWIWPDPQGRPGCASSPVFVTPSTRPERPQPGLTGRLRTASASVCIEFWAFVGGDLGAPDMALVRSLG